MVAPGDMQRILSHLDEFEAKERTVLFVVQSAHAEIDGLKTAGDDLRANVIALLSEWLVASKAAKTAAGESEERLLRLETDLTAHIHGAVSS